MKKFVLSVMQVWVCALALIGVAHAAQDTIIDKISNDKQLSTFDTALKDAGFVDALKGKGPFTLLAPTDAAFAQLPAGTFSELLKPENKEKLGQILKLHIVPREMPSKELPAGKTEVRGIGGQVTFDKTGSDITVNGAKVIQVLKGSNGLVYVIDTVLLPPEVK